MVTLLHDRIACSEPGRYWLAAKTDQIVGVVFQSPLTAAAVITPMPMEAVRRTVHAIAGTPAKLPGVTGDVASAAAFAGCWTECRNSRAVPAQGYRIYELMERGEPRAVAGRLRRAIPQDRETLVSWLRRFQTEVGAEGSDPEVFVDRRLAAGQYWLWRDSGPVAMAGHTQAVGGVVRIQAAYTPPERRNAGYGSACVAALSKQLHDQGHRCILYTDLGNPISNFIFRRLGYRAVGEGLRYQFD
jgi:hypothetical protein